MAPGAGALFHFNLSINHSCKARSDCFQICLLCPFHFDTMIYSPCFRWLQAAATALLCGFAFALHGQTDKLPAVTRSYAIVNATIIQAPGRKIENGTVLLKDGLITNVGKGLAIPPDAIVIKADSMYVYAGFIDGLSHTGVAKPKEEPRERIKNPGNPPPEKAGITPQESVRSSLSAGEKSVEEMRNLGFTASQSVPYGSVLPGQASVILLGGSSVNEMLLVSPSGLHANFSANASVYPATTMGIMAKWRDLYRSAAQAKTYQGMYASNRNGLGRPIADPILESFYPVIDQRLPVVFKAEKVLEIQRAMNLRSDLNFQLVLGEVKEGWPIVSKIKASGIKAYLSLDLPEETKEDKAKEQTFANDAMKAEHEALKKRSTDAMAQYVGQAATFYKAGVRFGFSSLTAKSKDIKSNLRRMIAAGLPEDAALAALTVTPSEWLGVADRLGTIDKGKMANLFIADKPYFAEKSKVKQVFVDGVLYEVEEKETKKPESGKSTTEGNWSFSTETPQGTRTWKIILKEEGGKLSGRIIDGSNGKEAELTDVKLEGKNLSFSFITEVEGAQIAIDVSAVMDKDTFTGSMTAGEYGSFPLKGSKDPK